MLKDNRRINQDLLKQAIKLNDMQLFEHLLERDNSLADDKFGKILNKPLHIACEYGRLDMMVQLLDTYMVELNAVCPLTGFTPLMYAVQANQVQIVQYLMGRQGVEIGVKSMFSGRDALQVAEEAEHGKVSEILQRQLKKV